MVLFIGDPGEVAGQLRGLTVVTSDACGAQPAADQFQNYFSTYNRTWLQRGVANVKAATEYLRRRFRGAEIILVADAKTAGVAVFAAPLVDAVIADCSELSDAADDALLRPGSFFPGIRRIGSFQGALELARSDRTVLHGAGGALELKMAKLGAKQVRSEKLTGASLANAIREAR